MYSSHVTHVFATIFFLNKIFLHMVIRSSTHFTCVYYYIEFHRPTCVEA
jgi:hypothetical protein